MTEGDYGVFVSNLHGKAESDGNIDIAKVLARKYKTNAFLLPLIDPQNPEANHLWDKYMPIGYPYRMNGKCPDLYINGKFFEIKNASDIEESDNVNILSNKISNRINKASKQADYISIRVPDWMQKQAIKSSVFDYLRRTKHVRSIVIIKGDAVTQYNANSIKNHN